MNKGTKIDIYVSTGAPKVTVPDVMGKSNNDAIAALADAKLKFKVLQVFSKEDAGTVVAQSPTAGRIVNQGSIVHINVSKGLQPLQVPDVRGQLFDNAAGQLQGAGFAVARHDVDSVQPKDTVIDQDPRGGGSLSRGGTVTLFVSKGPKQATIPDVTSQDEDSARAGTRAVGLQRRRAAAGHDRPGPGRDRALTGSARRHEGEARHHGDDLRRPRSCDVP